MKNLIIAISIFAAIVFCNRSNAQIVNLSISDSTFQCSNTKSIYLYVSTGSQAENNPEFTIYWGDGSTTVSSSESFPANSYWYATQFQHSYSATGNFQVYATCLSSVTNQIITTPETTIQNVGAGFCGQLYPTTYINSSSCSSMNNQLVGNPVYDLIGNDNSVVTFTQIINGVNQNLVPYTLRLNPEYLAQANLTQTSADIIINNFYNGYPDVSLFFELGELNPTSNCGIINVSSYLSFSCGQSAAQYFPTAVYDLVGNDQTITSFTGTNITHVDVSNVPYTLKLNPEWLQNNNFVQTSPDFIISEFGSNGYPSPNSYFNFSLIDQNTPNEPDLVFGFGVGVGMIPLERAELFLEVYNNACVNTPINSRITVEFPSFLTPIIDDLTNASINGNTLSFDYNDFNSTGNTILINFDMPGTTAEFSTLTFNCSIARLGGNETNLANNFATFYGTVYNSYDPNNKLVNHDSYLNSSALEEMQYTINFQNEGNFDALKVVVIDTISPNLDLSTFKVIYTKHPVATTVDPTTREVKFSFYNIHLAPKSIDEEASMGKIVYSIRENAALPVNSEIENTAYIYFDFNAPIVTNTTYNKNTALGVNVLAMEEVSIFPNPASDRFQIRGKNIRSVSLFDTSGKLVKTISNYDGSFISVIDLEKGIYLVQIQSDDQVKTEKIMVR